MDQPTAAGDTRMSVYVSARGRKYHKNSCDTISGELIEMTQKKAQQIGLEECKRCFIENGSETPHCPECQSPQIESRKGGIQVDDEHQTDTEWRCRDCGEEFIDADYIATQHAIGGGTTAAKLANELNADDVVPPSEVDQ
jgi:RNase P subunit RPR2